MVLVQILKRRDATSVIVAVVAALTILQFLSFVVTDLAARISGTSQPSFGPSPDWRQLYLLPFVTLILSFVAFELLTRLVLLLKTLFVKTPVASKKRR